MYQLENSAELAQIIELYKNSKVTKHSLEQELGKAASFLIRTAVQVSVKICDNEKSATNSTFLITSLPEIGQTSSLTIMIDKKAIVNLLTPEEVIKLLVSEVFNSQNIMKEYSRFIISKSNSDISVSDVLMIFLEIYKISLATFYAKHDEIAKRLVESKSIPSLEVINKETKVLADGEERLDVVIERLVINDILPYGLVERAKELAKKMRDDYLKDESFTQHSDRPNYNQFWQQTRGVVDGTYQIPGKKISHTYKPDTNQ